VRGRTLVLVFSGIVLAIVISLAVFRPELPHHGGVRADEWAARLTSEDPAEAARARADLVAGETHAVPLIMWLLRRDDPDLRRAGLDVLAQLGPKAKLALPLAIGLLEEGEPRAATALGAFREDAAQVLPHLVDALATDDEALREACLAAIARVGVPRASEVRPDRLAKMLDRLRALEDAKDPRVKETAARLLATLAPAAG
jgi:hypothetical protein